MKKLSILLFLALFTLYNSAGATDMVADGARQENRAIGSFKGVAAGGSLNVQITMGNKESIRLEGDEDAIADLITEVKAGILTIRPKTKWNDWSRKYKNVKVTVYITAKKISSLTMSGSGIMEVRNTINTTELVATLSGSGSMKASANLDSFVGVISGSGLLNLSGKANEANLTMSGSGKFAGKNFSVADLSAQISGSALVYINAEKKIEAVISGSGNILYYGDPAIHKTIIGSGSVKRI